MLNQVSWADRPLLLLSLVVEICKWGAGILLVDNLKYRKMTILICCKKRTRKMCKSGLNLHCVWMSVHHECLFGEACPAVPLVYMYAIAMQRLLWLAKWDVPPNLNSLSVKPFWANKKRFHLKTSLWLIMRTRYFFMFEKWLMLGPLLVVTMFDSTRQLAAGCRAVCVAFIYRLAMGTARPSTKYL